MPFGYIGQNQTKQQVKNSGVLSSFDISLLEKKGQAGGSLELIEEQSISTAFADFTNLGNYDVHLFQLHNVVPSATDNIGIRFSNNGGTSFISSGYQYAWQRGYPSTFTEIKSTSADRIILNGNIADNLNGYVYAYNLLNSSKYSFISQQTLGGLPIFSFGGGQLPTAETHNGVRFGTGSFSSLTSGSIKLYGVKQI